MPKVYHLDLDRRMLRGAKVALLPGDPARVDSIASLLVSLYAGSSSRLASKREFTTSLVEISRGKNVAVTSTGIGGPSASIAIEELARLGVETFVRVGTAGSIQAHIRTGDAVITTGAVRLDGASTHYAPIEYPAVADYSVVEALIKGAVKAGVRWHAGITASSDTFYQGEERKDSFRKYTIRRLKGSTLEWKSLHVLNYEMESSALLTITASMGLKGGCVTGVVNSAGGKKITGADLKRGVESAVRTAAEAVRFLL